MIAQWIPVGAEVEPLHYRLALNTFAQGAYVYRSADETWCAKVGTLRRFGLASADAACQWAVDTMRDGLKDALDQLEDVAPEMIIVHERQSAIVITEG